MPTAVSSTSGLLSAATAAAGSAVADVGHLLRFRATAVRRPRALVAVVLGLLALALATAVLPAYVDGAGTSRQALEVLVLLPSAFAGFLLLAVLSAAASGGGRELLARDPAAVHPISPTTDHLGALLLAPLNIAWILQAAALLGSTAYAVGPAHLATAQAVVLAWVLAATALAQVVAWLLEWLRRGPHGVLVVRVLGVAAVVAVALLQAADRLLPLLDQLPTATVVAGAVQGADVRWALTLLGVLLAGLASVVLGALPAHLAARRLPRDEAAVETGRFAARRLPRTAYGVLVRTDRASVWRAVPMRRGLTVLALGPGLVALLGDLPWSSLTVLPGLVASGGALLFGVNAWCLDGRGALWRGSLPASSASVFWARTWVLAEFLLVASLATVVLGGLRAGVPTPAELVALVCVLLVVTLQVVGAAMRWSIRRPYAVDLRSARATPAPPAVMVGYSTRLAVGTTVTGLIFSGVARAPHWELSVLVAGPFLLWSGVRLLRARDRWVDPVEQARVVTTVAV